MVVNHIKTLFGDRVSCAFNSHLRQLVEEPVEVGWRGAPWNAILQGAEHQATARRAAVEAVLAVAQNAAAAAEVRELQEVEVALMPQPGLFTIIHHHHKTQTGWQPDLNLNSTKIQI